jgi:hypothetical protein
METLTPWLQVRFLRNLKDTIWNPTRFNRRLQRLGIPLLVILVGFCAPRAEATDHGPISLWRGDGNTLDSVGENHAVAYVSEFKPGCLGQAFAFDAGGTRLEVRNPESLAFTNDFTFEFWAYLDDATPPRGHQTMVFRGDSRPGLDPYQI